MKIVFVYADNDQEWNSSEWRCVIPAQAIDRSPEHQADLLAVASFANRTPEAEQLCSQADLIVVERNLFGPVLTAIMHWKAREKGVIATFDDAYHLLPEDNLSHDFWMKGIARKEQDGKVVQEVLDPPPITQFKWGLRMIDGAVVASKKLVEDWEAYADVRHLPMYLDLERYRGLPEKDPGDDKVVIGWSGSLSHLHSFSSGILEALERVARARPQVRLKIGNDRRIYDKLKVPEGQKELTPWVPYGEWPEILASYDIGLAPMEGDYDARRSWVKVLEYMAVKVPWLASRSPAYQDLAHYGTLVQNTTEAWEQALLELVDNHKEHQKRAGGKPYQFALSQNAVNHVDQMVETFSSLINSSTESSAAGNTEETNPISEHISSKHTAELLDKARNHFQSGDLTAARITIDQMIEIQPEHDQALSLWKKIDQARKENNLPYLFPAGLGPAQSIDDISGLLSVGDLEALDYCAQQAQDVAVNIGVFNGLSTYYLAKNNPELQVYGIDAYLGMNAQRAQRDQAQIQLAEDNLSRQENAHLVVGLSAEVAAGWDKEIDLLLIDGDHSVEGALADFSHWSPFVKPGGIIAVHDAYRRVSTSILRVRERTNDHGPDLICEKMEADPDYEFIQVSGCTEVWRKTSSTQPQKRAEEPNKNQPLRSQPPKTSRPVDRRRVVNYAPETCLVFVSYGRPETARRSYLSLEEAVSPYREKIRIIISDATDQVDKINWARNTDADDVIITPRFTPAATSRNLAMTLILDKYSPTYLCLVEDDFKYSRDWYPSLVEAAESLYGVRSPYGLAYGLFSGCAHHIPVELKKEDPDNHVTAYLFGAVAYQRFTTTAHYLSVMRSWDADLLGISYAQTGGQTFRNTMRGYCGGILPGNLSEPLDQEGAKSTWSKGKRDPGPPAHSFQVSDYQAILDAAEDTGDYPDE